MIKFERRYSRPETIEMLDRRETAAFRKGFTVLARCAVHLVLRTALSVIGTGSTYVGLNAPTSRCARDALAAC